MPLARQKIGQVRQQTEIWTTTVGPSIGPAKGSDSSNICNFFRELISAESVATTGAKVQSPMSKCGKMTTTSGSGHEELVDMEYMSWQHTPSTKLARAKTETKTPIQLWQNSARLQRVPCHSRAKSDPQIKQGERFSMPNTRN